MVMGDFFRGFLQASGPPFPTPGPRAPSPTVEAGFPGELRRLADQPSREQSFAEFLLSTLSDPNPLHRAGLPLGVAGRVMEAEREMAEGMLGRIVAPVATARGQDPVAAWRESLPANIPVLGGLLPAVFQPSTYLTLGVGPTLRGLSLLRQAGPVGKALADSPLAAGVLRYNRAQDALLSRTVDPAVRGALGLAGKGLTAVWPTALETSPETAARNAVALLRDLRNRMEPQSVERWVPPVLGRLRAPDVATANARIGQAWNDLWQAVVNAPTPESKAFGFLAYRQAFELDRELLRRYEAALADQAAGHIPPDVNLGALLYNDRRQVQFALAQALEDFVRDAAKNPRLDLPAEHLDDLNQSLTRIFARHKAETDRLLQQAARQREQITQGLVQDEPAAVYQARDAEIRNLIAQSLGEVEAVLGAPRRSTLEDEAVRLMTSRLQGVHLNNFGLGLDRPGFLPDEMRQRLLPLSTTVERSNKRFASDQQRVVDALLGDRILLGKQIQGQAGPEPTLRGALEYLQQQGYLSQPTETVTALELVRGLERAVQDGQLTYDTANAIRSVLERWSRKGIDLLRSHPFEAAEPDVYRAVLGNKSTPRATGIPILGSMLRAAQAVWVPEVLGSLSYHLRNMLSADLTTLAAGYRDLLPAIHRRIAENLRGILGGGQGGAALLSQSARHFDTVRELPRPNRLVADPAHIVREILTEGRVTPAQYSPLTRAVAGGIPGFLAGGPLGAAYGVGVGLAAPVLARLGNLVRGSLEEAFRGIIYEHVVAQEEAKALPGFLDWLKQAASQPQYQMLAAPGTQVSGPMVKTQVGPRAKDIEELLDDLRKTGGAFGPGYLARRMNGLFPEPLINEATQRWVDLQHGFAQAGLKESDRVHFPSSQYTRLEELLNSVAPFMNWGRHAVPFFYERLLEYPAVGLALVRYLQFANAEREREGMPASFTGAAQAGRWSEPLATLLTGRPSGQLWVNPLAAILPFGDVLSAGARAGREDSFLAALNDLAGSMGAGFSGPVMLPLVASGALGNEPTPSYFRHMRLVTAPLQAIAGQFGANPGEPFLNTVRRITGQDPFDPLQYAVQKRLAEMSMEREGKVGHPQYIAAMRDPSSPLYREALTDVLRERVGRGLFGTVSPFSARPVTDTEAAVRQEGTNLPEGPADTPQKAEALQQALAAHPVAGAYMDVSGQQAASALQQALTALNNPVVLFPDVPRHVQDEMTRLWPDVQFFLSRGEPLPRGLAANPLVQLMLRRRQDVMKTPILQEYLSFRTTQHPGPRQEGEPGLLRQFLSQR